jgi:hypothetical protein
MIIIFVLLPESPCEPTIFGRSQKRRLILAGWLVSKGRDDQARKVLERLFAGVDDYDVVEHIVGC